MFTPEQYLHHPESHLFDFTPQTLREWLAARGVSQGFRADQILEWVYAKGVGDPALMSNLAPRDRETLAREMRFLSGETVRHQVATDGTQKLLIEWYGGGKEIREQGSTNREDARVVSGSTEPRPSGSGFAALPILNAPTSGDARPGDPSRQTETVMIPAENESGGERRTACVSSQIGCPVGCRFCASGLGGLDGSLSAGRIVEQVWRLARLLDVPGKPGRITNIVFMGMGEPLANFTSVMRAIRTMAAPWGLGISARKITLSTVGLPKAIERLAEEMDLPITLALSLHAPNDEIRRRLIPWAEFTTIEDLLGACAAWFRKTGREITLEYTLLSGVNDRVEHAEELAEVIRRMRTRAGGQANVNLIRYNEVAGLGFGRPATDDVVAFQRRLRDRGINAHIRASRGRDIAAACGQLRHETAAAS